MLRATPRGKGKKHLFIRPLIAAAAVAAALLAGSGLQLPPAVAAGTTVTITPRIIIMGTGNFTLNVSVNNVTHPDGLGGFMFTVAFDDEVLDFVSISSDAEIQSLFLGSAGRPVSCPGRNLTDTDEDGRTDKMRLSCTQWYDGSHMGAVQGSGVIVRITFASRALGMTELNFVDEARLVAWNLDGDTIPASFNDSGVSVIACRTADVNRDGRINASGDLLNIALHLSDRGVNSGVTLVADVDNSETVIPISDQSKLSVQQLVSVDNEQMTITALTEGSPDTMTVIRGQHSTPWTRAHSAGTSIYKPTQDGNNDGLKGYTGNRDVDKNTVLNSSGDLLTVASVLGVTCP